MVNRYDIGTYDTVCQLLLRFESNTDIDIWVFRKSVQYISQCWFLSIHKYVSLASVQFGCQRTVTTICIQQGPLQWKKKQLVSALWWTNYVMETLSSWSQTYLGIFFLNLLLHISLHVNCDALYLQQNSTAYYTDLIDWLLQFFISVPFSSSSLKEILCKHVVSLTLPQFHKVSIQP